MRNFTDLRNRVRMAVPSGGWRQVSLSPQDFLDLTGRCEQLTTAMEHIQDIVGNAVCTEQVLDHLYDLTLDGLRVETYN